MSNQELLRIYTAERDEIIRRLAWLGVRSTGYDRLEKRRDALDALIDTLKREAV